MPVQAYSNTDRPRVNSTASSGGNNNSSGGGDKENNNSEPVSTRTSTRIGLFNMPYGQRRSQAPFSQSPVTYPARHALLHSISSPPGLTFAQTPGNSETIGSPMGMPPTIGRSVTSAVLPSAPTRMIHVHGIHSYGNMNPLSNGMTETDWGSPTVPVNSPMNLDKSNAQRMGLNPVLRGLRHTPTDDGWNTFAALVNGKTTNDFRGVPVVEEREEDSQREMDVEKN
jgi:hypothetical protein